MAGNNRSNQSSQSDQPNGSSLSKSITIGCTIIGTFIALGALVFNQGRQAERIDQDEKNFEELKKLVGDIRLEHNHTVTALSEVVMATGTKDKVTSMPDQVSNKRGMAGQGDAVGANADFSKMRDLASSRKAELPSISIYTLKDGSIILSAPPGKTLKTEGAGEDGLHVFSK